MSILNPRQPWTKYFEQIKFWGEIEFLPPSFPPPMYNVEEE